jgi:hypothetical protein
VSSGVVVGTGVAVAAAKDPAWQAEMTTDMMINRPAFRKICGSMLVFMNPSHFLFVENLVWKRSE